MIQRGNNRGAGCFADSDDELDLALLQAMACDVRLRGPRLLPHDASRPPAPDARREAHRGMFRDALDEAVVNEIRTTANGGFVLGAARFQEVGE